MASGCGNKIIVWDYNDGKIEVIITLDSDQMQIQAQLLARIVITLFQVVLIQSICGALKMININQIRNASSCMILNSDETKLYTCENDSIIIWDVDFQNKKLELYQSFPAKKIYSLSLNKEETYLAAC